MSEYINTKYKYIFPSIDVFNESIDIEDVLIALNCPVDGHNNLCCPNNHKGKHKLAIHSKTRKDTNTCHCHNCGEFNGSPFKVAKFQKDLSTFDTLVWLSETFNVEKVLNPDYIPENGNGMTDQERAKAFHDMKKKQVSKEMNREILNKKIEVDYMEFDSTQEYKLVEDIRPFYPSGNKWEKLTTEQKLKVVYTFVYWFSKDQEQGAKTMYYKKRAINLKNKWLEKIGYISAKDFDVFLDAVTKKFPLDILEVTGIIKFDVLNNVKQDTYKLSWHYVKKGGIMTIPSFDLYTNMVTGFMLRPTHPEAWMKERGMKEIQLSNTEIIAPLPFGITYHTLKNNDEFRFTEGHPDSLAFNGNISDSDEVAFASIPGVNGLHLEHLGLFKGKKIIICFDQDLAGQKSAYGYYTVDTVEGKEEYIKEVEEKAYITTIKMNEFKKIEQKYHSYDGIKTLISNAGIKVEIKNWNKALGSDVNDVRINGNISELF